MTHNLIFLSKLDNKGYNYSGRGGVIKVYRKSSLIIKELLSENLYALVSKSMGGDVKVACTMGAMEISQKGNLGPGKAMSRSTKMIRKWVPIGGSRKSLDSGNSLN
ncbi:hypothetical protein GIB67_034189 [Kingdonia uniflora]|uniref:Uncharacterized protein n=1 Tax=Kingdonia uniflora TaxID=39325 RepID=A0A7J7NRF2_9MAGN|nr:hypothetical protein GIB67_034189 [Kingdonia uniflora]